MTSLIIKTMPVHIGYAATRQGLTQSQLGTLTRYLAHLSPDVVLHHGDCIGGDEQLHEIAQWFGFSLHIHPPLEDKHRAYCQGAERLELPLPYLERNHSIVNATSMLIAAPRTAEPELRSGTWATVRYANRMRRRILLLTPEGDQSWLPFIS